MTKLKAKVLAVRRRDFLYDGEYAGPGLEVWVCFPSDDLEWSGHKIDCVYVPAASPTSHDCVMLNHGDTVALRFDWLDRPCLVDCRPYCISDD